MSDKGSNIGLISLIILVVGVFMVALIKTPISVLFGGNSADTRTASVANHIKSVEAVNTRDTSPEDTETVAAVKTLPTEIKVASEVKPELKVPGICIACHGTGIAGAPKIGKKSDWEQRAKQGIDVLISSASGGKGNMPPQGASFNNEQLKEAIEVMLSKSGLAR